MTGRLAAIRYRPWQFLALLILSAVVSGTAILAPLYDRALQETMVRDLVTRAPADIAAVSVRSSALIEDGKFQAPYIASRMLVKFPASLRDLFEEPVTGVSTSVAVLGRGQVPSVGTLQFREGMCSHVELAEGVCPTAADEIAISADDAKVFGWKNGDTIRVAETSPLIDPPVAHQRVLEVVGVYATDPDQPYWVSRAPVGKAGLTNPEGATLHDGWLTAAETFTGASPVLEEGGWSSWAGPTQTVDLLLDRDRFGVDEMFAVGAPLQPYLNRPVDGATWRTGSAAQAFSGIPDLVTAAETGRDHAHALVPLFVLQLALLAALTLWLVLGAAVEQRRPEVAVVRLRGADAQSARRLLLRELGPPILFGWVLGMLAAAGALLVVGRRWLDPGLGLDITWLVVGTAFAVLAVELLLLWTSTWSTVTAGTADLLRRVRPRTGWGLSIAPVLLVVMSGAAFVATATGSLSGWVATAAPTLLAIAVGLLLAFLLGPVAGGAGGWLLARGRLVSGLSLLQLGRRHGSRTAIATIIASAALLAFAVNALGVGERNRTELARATVGAPAVLNVEGNDLGAVRAAVRELNQSDVRATVALQASSAGGGGISTIAVVPEEFARIAAFPDAAAARDMLAALRASGPAPIEVRGTRLTLETRWEGPGRSPIDLRVTVVRPASVARDVPLTPSRDRTQWHTDELPCEDGCQLTALVTESATDRDVEGTVTVGSASVGGPPLALGGQEDWLDATVQSTGFARPQTSSGGLVFTVSAPGGFEARLGHGSVPLRVPALTSGQLPPDSEEAAFTSVGLDGVLRNMEQVGTQPYLPGAPADTALVNLDVLERDGVEIDLATRLRVYLDGAGTVDEATQVLRDHGVPVTSSATIDGLRHDLQRSAPAWALQLGVVTGVVAALLAALVLALSFITSWRLRSADAVALRLNGVSTRRTTVIALLETVPLVVLSVALGIACGLIGSRIALPDLPFFDVEPMVPVEDLSNSWQSVVPVAVGLVVALAVLGILTSVRLGRRSMAHAAEDAA